jgi:hypothetical protein
MALRLSFGTVRQSCWTKDTSLYLKTWRESSFSWSRPSDLLTGVRPSDPWYSQADKWLRDTNLPSTRYIPLLLLNLRRSSWLCGRPLDLVDVLLSLWTSSWPWGRPLDIVDVLLSLWTSSWPWGRPLDLVDVLLTLWTSSCPCGRPLDLVESSWLENVTRPWNSLLLTLRQSNYLIEAVLWILTLQSSWPWCILVVLDAVLSNLRLSSRLCGCPIDLDVAILSLWGSSLGF